MEEEFLSQVYVYDNLKSLLAFTQKCFLLNKEGMNQLKNLLLYGPKGDGKSFIAHEYAKSFHFPIFVIRDQKDKDIFTTIKETFKKAKRWSAAVIIFYDIDRFAHDESWKVLDLFQKKVNRIPEDKKILCISTATDKMAFSPYQNVLQFDLKILVSTYSMVDIKGKRKIIERLLEKAGLSFSKDEISELYYEWIATNISDIKKTIDFAAAFYSEKCTIDQMLFVEDYMNNTIYSLDQNKYADYVIPRHMAINKAAQALYIYQYAKAYRFLRAYHFEKREDVVKELMDGYHFVSRQTLVDEIQYDLAGLIAEKLLTPGFDFFERHYEIDMIYYNCCRCINLFSLAYGFQYFDENITNIDELMEFVPQDPSGKKAVDFLKENYDLITKRIEQEKELIIAVADYLCEHKEITRDELIALINKKKGEK